MAIYYPPTKDFAQGTLGAELLDGVTASATLNTTASTIGLQNKLGTMIIDRVDANGVETPNKVEVVSFAGTSGSTVTTLVRGLAGTTDQDHAVGAIVEFGPDIVWAQGLIDFFLTEHTTAGVHTSTLVTTLKATGAVVDTGTSDVTIVTPKAIADCTILAKLTATQTLTNKRITQRVVTTTDDATAVIDCAVTDQYQLSAVANATEFTVTGTPTDGQKLIIRYKDAGVAKGLTFTGFTALGATIPTTTVASKWGYVGAVYNLAATTWHVLVATVEA